VKSTLVGFAAFCLGAVCLSTEAAAQQPVESRFSVDASIGWDNSISGDFLAAGIGELEGLPIVIQSTTFGDVYGTGAQWQFGVGYAIDAINEVRGQFTYQRVGSDVVTLGTAGVSTFVGTFDDYKVSTFDAGYRHYFAYPAEKLRPYAGATLGVAIIPEIDGIFAAPQAGIVRYQTDLYDGTAAFSFGVNGGLLYALSERFDVQAQIGFRHNSGLAEIDDLEGTGLGQINDKSTRWTLPITFGVRYKF
jgi:hypothetical protein